MHNKNRNTDRERRRVLSLLLAGTAATAAAGQAGEGSTADDASLCNPLLWAVAWKQTAAEYQALCHQAYNLAHMRLDLALARRAAGDRPLAVVSDVDDTIVHADSYWGYLINQGKDFFDDAIWDEWIPKNLVTPVPGALDFFNYCRSRQVEVFYVTNRNQGENTRRYALHHLQLLQLPNADSEHLFVPQDSSDKTPARDTIAATHEIAFFIGDNLNDYRRDYYVKDIDARLALMQRDRDDYGRNFILLPNPTDGQWVRAIFGESEPAASDANRRILRDAATRVAWDGN